jgi:DNA-binding CsgD family transcriptional regulator
VQRLGVEPLSPGAVAQLAEGRDLDPEALHDVTGGNAFFLTEVLAAGGQRIPPTVRDAVLARAARLGPDARRLLEAVAVASRDAEPWLIEAIAPAEAGGLEECIGAGMLAASGEGVAFRHELARRAVEEAIAPDRRAALHRAALAALEAREGIARLDPARLAHHAEAAGDPEAVLRHAPAAAERAAALGAHRQAAAQYAQALRFADGLGAAERAGLLQARAYECYLTSRLDEAIEAQEAAVALSRDLGDLRAEGDSLRRLAQMLGFVGRADEAAERCHEAVVLLEQLEPGPELAMAYGKLAQRYLNWHDLDAAIEWGTRALELAERLGDTEVTVYALVSVGAAQALLDSRAGEEKLDRALELARSAGLDDHVARAYLNLLCSTVRERRHDEAERHLEAGLRYASERGLDYWRLMLLYFRARVKLNQGHWTEAADAAAEALASPRITSAPRVLAGAIQGLVRARRGDPEVWPLLDEALVRAEPTGELQQIGPVVGARAEAAWLEGREVDLAELDGALELAIRRRDPWETGTLACLRRRAGGKPVDAPGAAEPYALELAGDWRGAAEAWERLECPYESALALAGADDDDALRRALDELQRLGAQPAAAIVARRLRERGATGLPRGPRASTLQNPAHLTARELDVLALVADGLRNAQIAERLFVSEKTVGHHVSAILRKLEVSTRGEAGAEATRRGLVEDRERPAAT